MSKTALSIQMLLILSVRDIVTKEELSNILDTNVRNIIEYKKELEYCGYDIEVIKGVGGGYRLNKDSIMPTIRLTEDEKKALLSASDYLMKRYDFLQKKEYQSALSKIMAGVRSKFEYPTNLIIDRFPLAMSEEEIKERYRTMQIAMDSLNKVEIEYLSSKNKLKTHIIHPYRLYMYNLAWYVLAFNESFSDFGYFKLNRIESYKILKDKYTLFKYFDESKYLDKFGMVQNGEFIDVSIELKKPYAALVRERIYGKNQTLEFVDENTTILNCKMQNKESIVSFVLGFGSKAKVLKPEYIKDLVLEELNKTIKKY